MSDKDDLEVIEEEDVPEDAQALQSGVIVGDDGVLGKLPKEKQPELQDEGGA